MSRNGSRVGLSTHVCRIESVTRSGGTKYTAPRHEAIRQRLFFSFETHSNSTADISHQAYRARPCVCSATIKARVSSAGNRGIRERKAAEKRTVETKAAQIGPLSCEERKPAVSERLNIFNALTKGPREAGDAALTVTNATAAAGTHRSWTAALFYPIEMILSLLISLILFIAVVVG